MMQKRILAVLIAVLSLPLAIPSSLAEEHPGRGHPNARHDRDFRRDHPRDTFRGRDIRRFREHDITVWHRGHWYHGPHDGHRGWWWVAGGTWYFYPAPIYPYPDPYLPPLIEAPLAPGYWYYCDDPPGYYPYVAACRVPWHAVQPGTEP